MTEVPGPAQAKYLHIRDQLRQAIREGRYQAGDRLPTEPVLAEQHGVALMTIRKALDLLKCDGTLDGRKGSGNYVQDLKQLRRLGAPRLAGDRRGTRETVLPTDGAHALDTDSVTITGETSAPPHIARVLHLGAQDKVFLQASRFLLAGRPVKLVHTYLSHELVAGTDLLHADTGHGSIHAALAAAGRAPVRAHEEVQCRMPTSDECTRLSIPPGRFVITAYRTAYDAADRPVEVEESVMDSAAYVLEYAYDL